jgi:hypothetical protein
VHNNCNPHRPPTSHHHARQSSPTTIPCRSHTAPPGRAPHRYTEPPPEQAEPQPKCSNEALATGQPEPPPSRPIQTRRRHLEPPLQRPGTTAVRKPASPHPTRAEDQVESPPGRPPTSPTGVRRGEQQPRLPPGAVEDARRPRPTEPRSGPTGPGRPPLPQEAAAATGGRRSSRPTPPSPRTTQPPPPLQQPPPHRRRSTGLPALALESAPASTAALPISFGGGGRRHRHGAGGSDGRRDLAGGLELGAARVSPGSPARSDARDRRLQIKRRRFGLVFGRLDLIEL